MSRCRVANLTRMLQTSSFNQTHVLVASNSSLSCLEERIFIITVLNPLPVLVVLKILWEIFSFTRSFMINTRPLVGCLKISGGKVKQFHVFLRIASSHLVYCLSIQCPICECIWFCNATPDLYRETVTQHTSH